MPAGYAPDSVAVTPDGKHVLVPDTYGGQVSLFSTKTRPVYRRSRSGASL